MPRPANPLTLVNSPSGHFPYGGWGDRVRTYPYFRIAGFQDFRCRAKISDKSDIANGMIAEQARKAVQDTWGNFLPRPLSKSDSIEKLGASQIKKAFDDKLLSFQTACLSIVALELAIQATGRSIDIYQHSENDPDAICICPVLFAVDGFGADGYTALITDPHEFKRVIAYTGQHRRRGAKPTDNVFADMSTGELVTERLARSFVEASPKKYASYSICDPRPVESNKFRKASKLETLMFPI